MGIALMALAFIPFFIAQISFIIGVVLMILGKKRDKRPLFIAGVVVVILSSIIMVVYVVLQLSNFFYFTYKLKTI